MISIHLDVTNKTKIFFLFSHISFRPFSNRGRCRVFHYQDILEAKHFKPFADTFFCILTYNPDARRLANTQGEIRVGASHQALLPTCQTHDPLAQSAAEPPPPHPASSWEALIWKHKQISDAHLLTYLQAARSIAAFAGMCDRGNADDMYEAAESDMTTIYALDVLHEQAYDTAKALQSLVKSPIPQIYDKRWSEDDQKKFVKGLRQFGKNFWLIHDELLPHKTTSDIVEYYYLWKKTPAAVNSNINRRRIRPVSSAKKTATSANKTSNNGNGSDLDSDNESDESSEQKQTSSSSSQTSCTNCYTTSSKDWQNGGQEGQLLCYDCRMYYKKYGELPQISNEQLLAANLLRSSKMATAKAEAKKEEMKSEPDVGDEDDKEVDEINNKSVKVEEADDDEPPSPKKETEVKVEAGAELAQANMIG